ncbi:MAG: hypothetical protein IPH48_10540 [bacterium]|nr:hypothetical protein [bacterium]
MSGSTGASASSEPASDARTRRRPRRQAMTPHGPGREQGAAERDHCPRRCRVDQRAGQGQPARRDREVQQGAADRARLVRRAHAAVEMPPGQHRGPAGCRQHHRQRHDRRRAFGAARPGARRQECAEQQAESEPGFLGEQGSDGRQCRDRDLATTALARGEPAIDRQQRQGGGQQFLDAGGPVERREGQRRGGKEEAGDGGGSRRQPAATAQSHHQQRRGGVQRQADDCVRRRLQAEQGPRSVPVRVLAQPAGGEPGGAFEQSGGARQQAPVVAAPPGTQHGQVPQNGRQGGGQGRPQTGAVAPGTGRSRRRGWRRVPRGSGPGIGICGNLVAGHGGSGRGGSPRMVTAGVGF